MAFSPSSSSLSAAPNVTPLIDVLLVLLIIFMVIVPVTPRGLNASVPLPASRRSVEEATPTVIHVRPLAGGGVGYQIGAERLDVAGLLKALQGASDRSARREVFVAGDERLEYRAVAETIAIARRAGFQVVGLTHEPKP